MPTTITQSPKWYPHNVFVQPVFQTLKSLQVIEMIKIKKKQQVLRESF